MQSNRFVEELSSLSFENTFNPYSHRCEVYDYVDAPKRRTATLAAMLDAACQVEVDAIWIGRDLGYRGGRRTGLALTDDVHIQAHAARWNVTAQRPTKGGAVAERTASVIWALLTRIESPIFLWNVFPLHPHEANDCFSNRSHNARERQAGEDLLSALVDLLEPKRLIAIGNDAAAAAQRIADNIPTYKVRHPSYGGQNDFIAQIGEFYALDDTQSAGRLL